MHYVGLEPGDPAPQFSQRGIEREFNLSNLGGYPVVLAFFLTSAVGVGQAVLEIVARYSNIFDGRTARLLAVSFDREDERRLRNSAGVDTILDADGKVARRYGAIPAQVPHGTTLIQYRPRIIVLDRRLRISANIELKPDGSDAGKIISEIEKLPVLAEQPPQDPPVLVVPDVFAHELCRGLISRFEMRERPETGIISQIGNRTTVVQDHDFKRRRDYDIDDPGLVTDLKAILRRRLLPEIAKAFQFQVTHVERHIVSRYSTEEQGRFQAHRDNNSLGTSHRRFACTINLNEDFEGGTLSFPEFGAGSIKAPAGGAVVFSCSLLHAVSVMRRGVRYAYLPFFYDDAAAKILEGNRVSWTHDVMAPAAQGLSRL